MIADTESEASAIIAQRPAPRTSRLIAGCVFAGALLALGFPPYGVPLVLPLAVAALLSVLDSLQARYAFYAGFLCGAVFFGATLFWMANIFGPAAISLIAICALFPAIFAALFVTIRTRLPAIPVWLLAPIIWTGVEYYRSERFVLSFGWMGL